MKSFLTEHIHTWTTAQELKTSNRGRSASNQSLLGIKKLRELILELAVRGKLVPQDPNDEPASELLKQIAKEKARLIKEGKIKKKIKSPKIELSENSFEIPKGWKFIRLNELGYFTGGGTPSKSKSIYWDGNIPWVSPKDMYSDFITDSELKITEEGVVNSTANLIPVGSLLIVARSGILKRKLPVSINMVECTVNQDIKVIVPYIQEVNIFIQLLLRGHQNFILEELVKQGMTVQSLEYEKFENQSFPLPPLAEQHRIVAKVDELMALCDELENQQTNSNVAHETLVATLLGSLTDAGNSNSFDKTWQRIANHFDILFTTEHSIDQLKQTILQLAVMGKLTQAFRERHPELVSGSNSASELLKKIAKEKARLVKEGKIKKQALQPEIIEDEKPFDLPERWDWVRLEALCSLITKGSSPKWQGVSYTENPEDVLFVTSENVGSYQLIFDNKKFVEMKFNEIEPRSVLMKGDYLMNIVGGSIGRTAIYDIDDLANINQAVCLIRMIPEFLNQPFFLHFFNSSICVSYMFDKQVDNARANLSMGNISKFVIPIPPLAEQHRIVSKVDELFGLCDGLKERLVEAQTLQNQMAVAVVEQALSIQPKGNVSYTINEQISMAAEPE